MSDNKVAVREPAMVQPAESKRGEYHCSGFSRAGRRHYLYYRWNNIKRRCLDPNNKDYARYGGRGITICNEWRQDSSKFITDVLTSIGERPTEEHTLDRIQNDSNYQLGNLRWATRKEQANNRKQRSAA